MTTLHTNINKRCPDVKKILLLGTKHVDTLSSSNLAIQSILLCHLAYGNQLIRSDFTTGDSWHDRECAVSLNVGEESVVCFLQVVELFVHDVLVEQARENGSDGGFAQFASKRVWVLADCFHDIDEGSQLLDRDDVVEIGSRVRDMNAHWASK